jgi:glycopeptide antibiotics resistance protein
LNSAGRIPIARSWLGIFALGVAAFTIYGSLVPFDFKERTFENAWDAFWTIGWGERIWPQSRSDGLANLLLGVPLGFCLLGMFRLDHRGHFKTIVYGLLIIPCCLIFASLVEFSQLWTKSRTCAASDAIAQALGAALGVAIWLGFGERLVRFARNLWDSPNIGGRFGRALLVYTLFLGAVETLPWDFTPSPSDWVRKVKTVTWTPFEEIRQPDLINPLDKSRAWAELIALFAPAGLLAAGLPGPWSKWRGLPLVVLCGFALGTVMEFAQWPVVSRHPSVTDVIIDGSAVILGWLVGRCLLPDSQRSGQTSTFLPSGKLPPILPVIAWLVLLSIYHWWPGNFDTTIVRDRLCDFQLLPFLSLEKKHTMMWLEEVTVKMLIVAPLGAAVWRSGRVMAFVFGAVVGLFFELGQLALPGHFPSITDVILAALGCVFGAVITQAIRQTDADRGICSLETAA